MGNKQNKGPRRSQSESDGLRNGGSRGGGGLDSPDLNERGKKGGKLSKSNSGKGTSSSGKEDKDGGGRKRTLSCPAGERTPVASSGVSRTAGDVGSGPGGGGTGELEVKIFRSYSNLTESRNSTSVIHDPALDMPNIKVYRRNTVSSSALQPSSRTMSLPRGFGRSRSSASAPSSRSVVDGDEGGGGRTSMRDLRGTSTLPHNRTASLRPSSVSSSQSNSSSSANNKVGREDFPDTAAIRRQLKQFESCFVRALVDRYGHLPPVSQLSTLTIALRLSQVVRGPSGHTQLLVTPVSMLDYMRDECGDIPADLENFDEFVLCIAPALIHGMSHVRQRDKLAATDGVVGDSGDVVRGWTSLSNDILTCVAAEAAGEVARIYEYQVSLVCGETAIRLLADHAAERSIAYIVSHQQDSSTAGQPAARLDRNTIVQGVVRSGQLRGSLAPQPPKFISVIVGEKKELKWNVYEIFSRPGLRRDLLLVRDDIPEPGEDDRCPWTYHVASAGEMVGARGGAVTPSSSAALSSSDHMVYGYRGQLVDWDYLDGVYRLNGPDERRFTEDSAWRYDDFHRLYIPYRWLVGSRAMKKYCLTQARLLNNNYNNGGVGGQKMTPTRLDQYLRGLVLETGYVRDFFQPVYRPLERFDIPTSGGARGLVDLGGVDMPPRTVASSKTIDSNGGVNNIETFIDRGSNARSNGDSVQVRQSTREPPAHVPSAFASPTQAHVLSPEDENRRRPTSTTVTMNDGRAYRPYEQLENLVKHSVDGSNSYRPRQTIQSSL